MRSAALATDLVFAVGILLAAGCGEGPHEGPGVELDRTVMRGDTLVRQLVDSPDPDSVEWVAVEEFGRHEGPEDLVLGQIIAFAVAGDGSVVVFDGDVRTLTRFLLDSDSAEVLARTGRGPGEVGWVTALAIDTAGNLYARDARNDRVLVLSPDGSVAGHIEWVDRRTLYGSRGLTFSSPDRLFLGFEVEFDEHGVERWPRRVYETRRVPSGEVLDTLYIEAGGSVCVPADVRYRTGFWEDYRSTYLPRTRWAVLRGGRLVVGCPVTYRFLIRALDGSSLVAVRHSAPTRVPVLKEEAENLQRWRESERLAQFDWSGFPLPDQKPAYYELLAGQDGRIWVWRPGLSEEEPMGSTSRADVPATRWNVAANGSYDVYAEDGSWLMTVPYPPGMLVALEPPVPRPVMRGDTMWAVTLGEFDTQIITRFELRVRQDQGQP